MRIRCSPRYCKHRFNQTHFATDDNREGRVWRDAKPGDLLFMFITCFSVGKRSRAATYTWSLDYSLVKASFYCLGKSSM